jgi:dienelactone hydrolase
METFVEFRNRAGKQLRGMIHRPPKARSRRGTPAVIFFHGFTGDRMESHWIFVKCARALAASGIASLRFDFYGSGESEGDFLEVTLQGEIADARAAVEFLRRYRGIDRNRLGLLGLSLGGTIAASIARESQASALVLWAAVAHPRELRRLAGRATKPIAGSDGAREYCGHAVSSRFLENLSKIDPLGSLAQFKNPTLIVHPEKDEHLSLAHPEDYYRAVAAPLKDKVIIPGADHTFTSLVWEEEVIRRSVEWFRSHLLSDSE